MNPGYKHFLETLNLLCRQTQSGVLHFYTAENHYGRIALVSGEITHVSLHTARCMTALPWLVNANISSHRFEPDAALPISDDLLETENILVMLGSGELVRPPAPSMAQPPVGAAPISPATAAPSSGITAVELGLIEQELHRELGPMAGSLIHECLPHARTPYMLVEMLADQLMSDEGAKFLTRATELLRARAAQ